MGLTTLLVVHVGLSIVGIAAGLAVVVGMLQNRRRDRPTTIFLVSTILTNSTGFLFPFHEALPSHGIALLSLGALALASYAWYVRDIAGGWRPVWIYTSILSLYLNVVVLVVQLFLKVPALRDLAPTQAEPPFLVTQAVILLVFAGLTGAARGFRPTSVSVRGSL
jgi:hypothetical protein